MSRTFKRFAAAAALLGTVAGTAAVGQSVDARGSRWIRSVPSMSVLDAVASEDDGTIDFEVELSRPAGWFGAWTSVYLRGITARPGEDFEGRWQTVYIPRGHTSATVSVDLIDDAVDEPVEDFYVKLGIVLGARRGDTRAVGTINDDARTVNLLHINDHHSHLEEDGADVDLGTAGGAFDYAFGGFPRVAAKIAELESTVENPVKIHAGDAITGTLYYTLFKGEADAAMMNDVCFDMFALGNHEFDDSDAGLAQFLDWLAEGDCGTPVLAANVIPEIGTPLAPTAADDYLQPYVVKDFDGEQVAFIGLDIAQKTQVSSSPLGTTQFLDEAETAQRYVDELTAMGIDNIVLVTHYQYQQDLALAAQVTDIDAIVGGDSHTLLGDFGPFGSGDGDYPTIVSNADGDPVCVVQAWQYAAVVGELAVSFDQGKNVGCVGTPHLLVDDFTREDPETEEDVAVDGAELAEIEAIIGTIPSVSIVEPKPSSQQILDVYSAEVEVLSQEVIGAAAEPLCLGRLPGDSRGAPFCTPDQVAASGARSDVNGGFIQQIVTDAFLARAFRADIALQNAGGVRVTLPAGDISIGDAYTVLPFANTLVEMEMTGAEISAVLEEAVTNFVDNGGSTGSYPYGSAIRWDVDLSQAAGSRFSNIEVRADDGTWSAIDPAATYVVVTNSFLAAGRDGWTTFGTVTAGGRTVDTFIDYAQGFIDWIEQDAGGAISVPSPEDFSTQSFGDAPAP